MLAKLHTIKLELQAAQDRHTEAGMNDQPQPHWAERSWPIQPVILTDLHTACALVPHMTRDAFSSPDAWFWQSKISPGHVVAVARITGSVHESTIPFDSLPDAAEDFRTHWPAGLMAEHLGAEGWMAHVAARNGQPIPPSGLHPAVPS
jgi:hypothetical protein